MIGHRHVKVSFGNIFVLCIYWHIKGNCVEISFATNCALTNKQLFCMLNFKLPSIALLFIGNNVTHFNRPTAIENFSQWPMKYWNSDKLHEAVNFQTLSQYMIFFC